MKIELSLSDIAAIITNGSEYIYCCKGGPVTLKLDTEDLRCDRDDYDCMMDEIKEYIDEL